MALAASMGFATLGALLARAGHWIASLLPFALVAFTGYPALLALWDRAVLVPRILALGIDERGLRDPRDGARVTWNEMTLLGARHERLQLRMPGNSIAVVPLRLFIAPDRARWEICRRVTRPRTPGYRA